MAEGGNSKAGMLGALIAFIGFIALQIRTHFLKAKLAKAEGAKKKLEQKIKVERQQVAAEKIKEKADVVKTRIESREKKLEALYEKIGVLDSESKLVTERVDAARDKLPSKSRREKRRERRRNR
jgi:cell division protein FtsX